jgi:hypothetical protein
MAEIKTEIERYLTGILPRVVPAAPSETESSETPETIARKVFGILTSREFCYMGRARTKPYEKESIRLIERRIRNSEPLRFYYDIGAGYHATVHPGVTGLSFGVGLSELFILSQAVNFCNRVAAIYPRGIEFYLVIDNVCALMTNDIPLENTTGYCRAIRTLIEDLGIGATVKTLVESEQFPLSAYKIDEEELREQTRTIKPTNWDVENVWRFLGRRCGEDEVIERMARYKQTGRMTDTFFGGIIKDVHMTQRATPSTLGFRPFPGGDSRTQCGEVALTRKTKGRLRPFLLTSRNASDFTLTTLQYPELLPPVISHVTYAERICR